MATRYRVVLITVPDKKVGLKLTQGLVDGNLAACVNFIPGVESYYRWKGKVEKSSEVLLLAKTQKHLVDTIASYVRENHPYELCEVVSLPVTEGSKAYLEWIAAGTNPPRPPREVEKEDLEREVD